LLKAISLDPRSEFIRYSYAALLGRKGDRAGQKQQLGWILESNPRAADAALSLAAIAVLDGDLNGSEAILRSSYKAGVRDPDLLDRLGHHLLGKDLQDEAAWYFEEALKLRPDDPVALLETGRAALRTGDAGRAIERLDRCTEGQRAFECRMELARAYLLGPRDLAAARRHLVAARALATDDRKRRDVDLRLRALDEMAAEEMPR